MVKPETKHVCVMCVPCLKAVCMHPVQGTPLPGSPAHLHRYSLPITNNSPSRETRKCQMPSLSVIILFVYLFMLDSSHWNITPTRARTVCIFFTVGSISWSNICYAICEQRYIKTTFTPPQSVFLTSRVTGWRKPQIHKRIYYMLIMLFF